MLILISPKEGQSRKFRILENTTMYLGFNKDTFKVGDIVHVGFWTGTGWEVQKDSPNSPIVWMHHSVKHEELGE